MPLFAPVTITVRPSCSGRSAEVHLVEVTSLNVSVGGNVVVSQASMVVEIAAAGLFIITPTK
jgi:hypothetical protein